MDLSKQSYALRLLFALSLLLCAVFGGRGYETICAAAWRHRCSKDWYKYYWATYTICLMDLWEPEHCYKSWLRYHRILGGLDIGERE